MPERFEQITKKIEKAAELPKEKRGEVLEFSPEEKAEHLWTFYTDYRREKYELLLTERKRPFEERKKLEEIEEEPKLLKLKQSRTDAENARSVYFIDFDLIKDLNKKF